MATYSSNTTIKIAAAVTQIAPSGAVGTIVSHTVPAGYTFRGNAYTNAAAEFVVNGQLITYMAAGVYPIEAGAGAAIQVVNATDTNIVSLIGVNYTNTP